jgi:glycosyltransferase involved in cell wall biosynthesis
MRIGIDIQTLETYEATRGIGRLCRQTVEALLRHAPEHEIILFGRAPEPPAAAASLVAAGARYVPLHFDVPAEESLRLGCVGNFLWATPEAHDLDLYHATSPLMNDILLPAVAPCPVVATLLDAIPAVMHERRQPILSPHEWERYCQRVQVLRTWQAFAAISQTTADDCVRLFDLPEDRVRVTYVPVEQRPLAGLSQQHVGAVLARHDLSPGYVLSVMGFHPRKNFEALFGAYGRLPLSLRKRVPLVVVCALQPDEKEKLLKLARQHRCADTLRLLGFVPDSDFPAILSAAAVMIFPSRYEGFGLPPAEAMAAGVPVIAANRSSLPEVVGEAGILCEVDDHPQFAAALQRVLEDPAQAKWMQAEGFLQVGKFAPEEFVRRLLECYQLACDQRKPVVSVEKDVGSLRVAVFTPLSPKFSGIADFAEQLVLNFSDSVSADCYVDDYTPTHPLLRERATIRKHWEFLRQHRERPYDIVLYEMGNNTLHSYMLPYLECIPGVVDLHDFSILGLLQHLTRHYGWGAEAERWAARDRGIAGQSRATGKSLLEANALDLPCTRWLLYSHRAMVVHSQWLADHMADSKTQGACPVTHIPLGLDLGMVRHQRPSREELRRKYHITSAAFVVACVGMMNRLKRLPQVVAAFRDFNLSCPESYLVFVGPADRLVLREVVQLAARYRIKNRMRILGPRPLPEFYEVLDIADVVVNLRYPTMGESSATLVAGLGMGKPTLVTPLGQYLEFPDDVCPKVPPGRHEKRVLYEHLMELYANPQLRAQIGENARKHVELWAYHAIAARYEQLFAELKMQSATNHS